MLLQARARTDGFQVGGIAARRMGGIITADHAAKNDLHLRTRWLAGV